VAIERIRETEKYTPKEGAWRNPDKDPKEEKYKKYVQKIFLAFRKYNFIFKKNIDYSIRWLKKGKVEFKELTLSYAPDLPAVLRGVNLSIKAGERVGVCGRTGAGKSSLAAALFNLVESWNGEILLDGVSVKDLGLHALRSQLTIIPQDPVLFNRSLRDNLDPAGSASDERVWRVLEQSQMAAVVKGLKGGLEHTVEEGETCNFFL
jgi:ABC-type multidrug transport system fused ATPase/permease subunit